MRYQDLETYADPPNDNRESLAPNLESSILLEAALLATGPVLELGCGTGRVTIALARRGIDITGVDILPHMIEYARGKSTDLPINWICDDVCTFQLDAHFSLIFTWGTVFQHLLKRSEQEAMLSRVREHLAPGGRFIVDIIHKSPKPTVSDQEETAWYSYVDGSGRTVQVSGTDRFDHVDQIWYQTYYRRWLEDGDAKTAGPSELALRYFVPHEVESLLRQNGFKIQARCGDWTGSPLTEDSSLQLYVCTQL